MPARRFSLPRVSSLIAAVVAGAVPLVAVWDFGGVLPWTLWAALAAGLVGIVLAIPALVVRRRVRLLSAAVPLLLLAVWGYAMLQSVPLPAAVVAQVSPGSAAAREDFLRGGVRDRLERLAPPLDAGLPGQRFATSVSPWQTRSAAALPAVAAAVALLAAVGFRSTRPVLVLLVAVTLTGVALSFFGLLFKIRHPGEPIGAVGQARVGAPFGPFVNRNNAAGFLNATLAAGVGLAVWRGRRLRGRGRVDRRYEMDIGPFWQRWTEAFRRRVRTADHWQIVTLCACCFIAAGVFATASRGGCLGAAAGLVAALLVPQARRQRSGSLLGVAVVGVGAMLILGLIDMIDPTLLRLGTLFESDVLDEGRLPHWRDGLRAAAAYLPAGAGWGTYQFAYLPYQRHSSGSWFMNADNLWLEWLVELGVPGVAVGLTLLAVVVVSLWRLTGVRRAPALSGLAAAGWFLVGSQLVCQFFDFGMSLLALATLVSVLAAVIATQAALLEPGGAGARKKRRRPRFPHSPGRTRASRGSARSAATRRESPAPSSPNPAGGRVIPLAPLLWTLLTLAVGGAAGMTFPIARDAARVDALALAARAWRPDAAAMSASPEPAEIAEIARRAAELADRHPDSADAQRLAATASLRALRVATADAAGAPGSEAWRTAYFYAAVGITRARYFVARDHQEGPPPTVEQVLPEAQSVDRLRGARDRLLRAVSASPLDDGPRLRLAELDFLDAASVGRSTPADSDARAAAPLRPLTPPLLDDLLRLRPRNATVLERAARIAVVHPGPEAAAPLWRAALEANPGGLRDVLRFSQAIPPELLAERILPDDPEVLLASARRHVSGAARRAALERAGRLLDRGALLEDPIRRAIVTAEVAEALEDWPAAAAAYHEALRYQPTNAQWRLRRATVLQRLGRIQEARHEAEQAERLDPSDKAVREFLRQLPR